MRGAQDPTINGHSVETDHTKKLQLPVTDKLLIPTRAGCCYGDCIFGNTIDRKARYSSKLVDI